MSVFRSASLPLAALCSALALMTSAPALAQQAPGAPAAAPTAPAAAEPEAPVSVVPSPSPEPAAEAPAAHPAPAVVPQAAAAALDPAAEFQAQCWSFVDYQGRPPALFKATNFNGHVVQAGYGALTRRAAYTQDGNDDRVQETDQAQQDIRRDLVVRQVALPVVVGTVGLALAPAVILAGVVGGALWLLRDGAARPLVNNNTDASQVTSYVVLLVGVAAVPVGVALGAGALVPLIMGIYKGIQWRSIPPSPLLDQTGFPGTEAYELANSHNERLAKRLGLTKPPACAAR